MDGMQQGIGAYGAGRAGGAFDPLTFIQQPHTGLRIVSWVGIAVTVRHVECVTYGVVYCDVQMML